jgi:hypothetical protein
MAFNFKNYLQNKLQALTDLSVKVVDELDFKLESDIKVIIKYLTGTIYQDTLLQPMQLYVITDKFEEARFLMQTFVETYSQTRDKFEFKHFKQVYNTPVVLENFIPIKNKQSNALYVNATLTLLGDVVDIEKITIDDEEIKFVDAQEHYIVQSTSQKIAGYELSYNKKQTATYSLTIICKNSNNVFLRKIKQMRHGQLSGNTAFNVKIYYDNDATPMQHNMVVMSSILATTESTFPTSTITLGVDK